MNAWVLTLLGIGVAATAAVALSLRNIVRSVLLLVFTWFGIAAIYLWAGAEFAAFAQALVYGGAVSMVVLFAVLLTRKAPLDVQAAKVPAGRAVSAVVVGGAVAVVLSVAVLRGLSARGTLLRQGSGGQAARSTSGLSNVVSMGQGHPFVTVRSLGELLSGPHAAALLVAGVLLTVALIGGVVLAAGGKERAP